MKLLVVAATKAELGKVFEHFNLPDENFIQQDKFDIIITHSMGIISALNYCFENKINPKLIVAMDPPDISNQAIKLRYNDMNENFKKIYDIFLNSSIDITNYNIHNIRNAKNSEYIDNSLYKQIYFYNKDTHYPYHIKEIRDRIVEAVKTCADHKN